MNCKQAEELLPLYAGRDLDEERATLVSEHLQTCAACARLADEYCESIQLTEQLAPVDFSEAVYAGIRKRVLCEIEKQTAPPWSQTIASLFQPRLSWAIASVLLMVVSMFVIYFIVKKGNDKPQPADKRPAVVQPEKNEPRRDESPSESTGAEKQQLAGAHQQRRKRFRAKSTEAMLVANSVSRQPGNVPDGVVPPHSDSAALSKTLRVEIQTKDPNIRIIWFVPQETKPINSSSKGD
jgi:Putative zinc-finger